VAGGDYLERILRAQVYAVAVETPLQRAAGLSARLGCSLFLKREDEQPIFSFKLRGAYNKIAALSDEQRARGVLAASAGNHAQGVALAASRLGIHAQIVMPGTTPSIKIDAVDRLGAEVILHGDTYDQAQAHAETLVGRSGRTLIHPYDDPDVIAGQGTVGMEILRQHPDPIDAVFVPVGGGGLIAGVAAFVKKLRPQTKIIGVEPEDAASMHASLQAGRIVELDQVGLFADGVATKSVGKETFRLAKELVDEMILVDTDTICAAIKDVFQDTRAILEPAGALAVAGAKVYAARSGEGEGEAAGTRSSASLIAICSGANMNFDRLRHVSERAELGEQREAIFAVRIPEKPGSLKAFCSLIGTRGITEFNYRYASEESANIFVGVGLRAKNEAGALAAALSKAGLETLDLSSNEMAKLHVRHMVGGHAASVTDEVLYRFEFPERPGALMRFLERMSHSWNISLFHYRNHGTDYGRVLIGMQVPASDRQRFQAFLDELGYPYVEETGNPAYRLFLG